MIRNKRFVFCFIWVFFLSVLNASATTPTFGNGIIYFKSDSSNRFKNLLLNGEWRFFRNEFVHPDSVVLRKDYQLVSASEFWNKQKIDDHYYPSQGFGTFYLQIVIPNSSNWYGLELNEIMSAAECYVDGKLLLKAGKPASNAREEVPEFKTSPILIIPQSDTLDIVIHVSNFNHPNGGFFKSPMFGRFDTIMRSRLWTILIDMFLFASLIMIGVYHIYMFFIYRENKFFFWFGFMSLAYAIRPLFSGAELLVYFFTPSWKTIFSIRFLSLYLASFSFIMYFYTFKATFFSRKLLYIVQLIFLFLILSPFLFNTATFISFLPYFMVFMFILFSYLLYVYFKKSKLKDFQDRIIFAIVIMVVVAAINDYAVNQTYVSHSYLIPYAILVFFIAQADIIGRNLRLALKNVQEFKTKLENQNLYLEELVEKRHKSIVDGYNQIVKANEDLESKKNIIQRQRELVQTQREKLKNTIDFMPEMLFECSQNGRLIMANIKFYQITGYSKEQLKEGINIFNLFVLDEELQKLKYDLIHYKEIRNQVVSIKDFRNNVIHISISMSVLVEGGFTKGYRGVMIDITGQEVLRKKMLKLQMALEQSMNAVIMFDLSGKIEFANAQFLKIVNLSKNDVLHKDISQFRNPLNNADKESSYWNYLIRGKMWSGNIEFQLESMNKMYFHTTMSPLYGQEEQIEAFLAIMEDVSETIENENARLELLKNLTIREKEITQSMNYARVLQNAIMSSKESLDVYFRHYFIINKPLDIISGDFYYLRSYGSKIILAVADSTGHGTPGAIMSVLGVSLFNEIILQTPELEANEVLKQLRNKIISILANDKNKALRDGIDMALCIIDKENKSVQYSGANRPLIIVPDNEVKLIKPNKQALGANYALSDFDKHCVYYKESCIIYLFSDGITDQFSAESGKKFGRNRLIEMINMVYKLEVNIQEYEIKNTLELWQGTEKQVDDMLMVGIEVSSSF